jgi:pyrimidine-nucleoside phosphorylase
MDVPLGRAVGNSLEVAECIDILGGRGPDDLTGLVVHEATRMVRLAGKAATDAEAEHAVAGALSSGAAREKFKQMIAWQGGDARVVDDPGLLPAASRSHAVAAPKAGVVQALDALLIGRAAVALGAGRDKKGDRVDLAAGLLLHRKPGEAVAAGEPVLELRYNDETRLQNAVSLATQALVIGDKPVTEGPLVMGWVHESGETMFVGGM